MTAILRLDTDDNRQMLHSHKELRSAKRSNTVITYRLSLNLDCRGRCISIPG